MKRKRSSSNPVEAPIRELFNRLTILNGLLFNLQGQLNDFRNTFKKQLEEKSIDLSVIWSGVVLGIRDLAEWPQHDYAVHYRAGAFTARGDEYFDLVDTLVSKQSTWSVVKGFEAFKTFLIDMVATYLMEHRNLVNSKKLEKFTSKKQLSPEKYAEWREFARFSYRENKDRLKYLGKLAPQVTEVECKNNRDLDLNDWYLVVAEVRHAETHSDSVIKKGRMGSWSRQKRSIRNQYFPGVEVDNGYELRLDQENAKTNLELFAEYGLTIFKSLSEVHGYNWKEVLR